jgi:hypothetical protein
MDLLPLADATCPACGQMASMRERLAVSVYTCPSGHVWKTGFWNGIECTCEQCDPEGHA